MSEKEHDWLIATLHCVLHIPQLTNFLLDDHLVRSSLVTKRKNACEFAVGVSELAKTYWSKGSSGPISSDTSSSYTSLDGTAFDKVLDAFLRIHRSFKGKRHDRNAADAVRACLETFHLAFGNVPDVEHPVRFDDDVRTTPRSIVSDVFEGVFDDAKTFTAVSIDDTSVTTTIVKSLESYAFRRTPLMLVLKLPDHFVSYDVDLTMIERGFQVPYALVAVLLHHHEDDGRWTTLACHDGQWRHFENDHVTSVPVNSIVQKNAAMLLYKRLLPRK